MLVDDNNKNSIVVVSTNIMFIIILFTYINVFTIDDNIVIYHYHYIYVCYNITHIVCCTDTLYFIHVILTCYSYFTYNMYWLMCKVIPPPIIQDVNICRLNQ